jgi:hypothetical protein
VGQVADVVVLGPAANRRGITEDYLEIDLPAGAAARGERISVVIERARAG